MQQAASWVGALVGLLAALGAGALFGQGASSTRSASLFGGGHGISISDQVQTQGRTGLRPIVYRMILRIILAAILVPLMLPAQAGTAYVVDPSLPYYKGRSAVSVVEELKADDCDEVYPRLGQRRKGVPRAGESAEGRGGKGIGCWWT